MEVEKWIDEGEIPSTYAEFLQKLVRMKYISSSEKLILNEICLKIWESLISVVMKEMHSLKKDYDIWKRRIKCAKDVSGIMDDFYRTTDVDVGTYDCMKIVKERALNVAKEKFDRCNEMANINAPFKRELLFFLSFDK